jgi:hypothetical protein
MQTPPSKAEASSHDQIRLGRRGSGERLPKIMMVAINQKIAWCPPIPNASAKFLSPEGKAQAVCFDPSFHHQYGAGHMVNEAIGCAADHPVV